MDRKQQAHLNRLVWRDRLRSSVLPVLLGGAILAALGTASLNVPISSRQDLCDFQRLSYPATNYSWSSPVAFCVLKSGETVMFRVPDVWIPPAPGSAVRITIVELVFGVRYQLTP